MEGACVAEPHRRIFGPSWAGLCRATSPASLHSHDACLLWPPHWRYWRHWRFSMRTKRAVPHHTRQARPATRRGGAAAEQRAKHCGNGTRLPSAAVRRRHAVGETIPRWRCAGRGGPRLEVGADGTPSRGGVARAWRGVAPSGRHHREHRGGGAGGGAAKSSPAVRVSGGWKRDQREMKAPSTTPPTRPASELLRCRQRLDGALKTPSGSVTVPGSNTDQGRGLVFVDELQRSSKLTLLNSLRPYLVTLFLSGSWPCRAEGRKAARLTIRPFSQGIDEGNGGGDVGHGRLRWRKAAPKNPISPR